MKLRRIKIIIVSLFFVSIFAISLGGYLFYRLYKVNQNFEIKNEKDIENLLEKIDKIYLTPPGEVPTIATVTNPELLKEKSFFLNSERDDKVLIYAKSKKALLYRPSLNKIVDIVSLKDIPNNENVVNQLSDE